MKKIIQQQHILKGMNIEEKLIIAIQRSESAYQNYKIEKLYCQASRIFNANKEVYCLLQSYIYEEGIIEIESVFNFIFHLEDWFLQFEAIKDKNQPQLEDIFVFERLKVSFIYPKQFIHQLKQNS